MVYKKIEDSSLADRISKEIIHSYVIGELKPGQRLSEENLGNQFGVSRSPVREALREMDHQGIVRIIPRKGAFVSKWTIRDFLDFSELRANLECFSAKLAARSSGEKDMREIFEIIDKLRIYRERPDLEKTVDYNLQFHSKIADLTQNKSLINTLQSLRLRSLIYSIYSYSILEKTNNIYLEQEHFNVAQAIEQNDPELAEKMMNEHVMKSKKILESELHKKSVDNIDNDLSSVLDTFNISINNDFKNLI